MTELTFHAFDVGKAVEGPILHFTIFIAKVT